MRGHADEDAPQGAHDDLDAWSHAEHLLRRRRIRVVALCAGRRQTSEQRQTLAPGQRGQWMHRALIALREGQGWRTGAEPAAQLARVGGRVPHRGAAAAALDRPPPAHVLERAAEARGPLSAEAESFARAAKNWLFFLSFAFFFK